MVCKKEKTEETESFFKLKANEIDNHKNFFIAKIKRFQVTFQIMWVKNWKI